MALITCRECGEQISSEATTCPKCGCPVVSEPQKAKKRFISKKIAILGLAILLLIVIGNRLYWAVEDHELFLSSDSKMQYYFDQSISIGGYWEYTTLASDFFNDHYAGTAKEDTAIEMLMDRVTPDVLFSSSGINEVVSAMDTDNEEIELLREVTGFMENVVYVYDLTDDPSEYVGKMVLLSGRLEKVDDDRGAIKLEGSSYSTFECFYNTQLYSGIADWSSNQNSSGNSVLCYGLIKQYSDSNKTYMTMLSSADSSECDTQEAIDFILTLESLPYSLAVPAK